MDAYAHLVNLARKEKERERKRGKQKPVVETGGRHERSLSGAMGLSPHELHPVGVKLTELVAQSCSILCTANQDFKISTPECIRYPPKCAFLRLNDEKFSEDSPFPRPLPRQGRGNPLPAPPPSRRLQRLDSRAFGALSNFQTKRKLVPPLFGTKLCLCRPPIYRERGNNEKRLCTIGLHFTVILRTPHNTSSVEHGKAMFEVSIIWFTLTPGQRCLHVRPVTTQLFTKVASKGKGKAQMKKTCFMFFL